MQPFDPRPMPDGASGRRRPILLLSLAWAVVLLFLLFVWPTPWRHPDGREDVRESRLTGRTEVRDARTGDWRPAKRGRGNGKGTPAGSPVGGGRSRSGGEGPGETWWYREDGEPRNGADGDRWWYREGGGKGSEGGGRGWERRSGSGSPIGGGRSGNGRNGSEGGDRGGRRGGSPIGGD